MNDLKTEALNLNKELKDNPLIKEYLFLKQKIIDLKLHEKENELKQQQKELTNSFMKNNPNYEKLKQKYLKDKEEFDNHPIMINYLNIQEEVEDMLHQIKLLIEKRI